MYAFSVFYFPNFDGEVEGATCNEFWERGERGGLGRVWRKRVVFVVVVVVVFVVVVFVVVVVIVVIVVVVVVVNNMNFSYLHQHFGDKLHGNHGL